MAQKSAVLRCQAILWQPVAASATLLFIVSRLLVTADIFGSAGVSERKLEQVLPPLSIKHTAGAHGHWSLCQTSGCSAV